MGTNRAYISFGSNLGKREENIKNAIWLMSEDPNITIKKVSSIYETEPFGKKDQGWFLNGVLEILTKFPPYDLLMVLEDIERRLGRKRSIKWGPRTIDLDILLFGKELIETPNLKVPHPGLHQRNFVLVPLAEIAPTLIHPRLKKTIEELLLESDDMCEVRRWEG